MAFIGCYQPTGAIMPIAEMQCRYAMQVFKVCLHEECHSVCLRIHGRYSFDIQDKLA